MEKNGKRMTVLRGGKLKVKGETLKGRRGKLKVGGVVMERQDRRGVCMSVQVFQVTPLAGRLFVSTNSCMCI